MKYFIEEFSFCEIGYDFLEFEGTRQFVSTKYGFKVEFKNTTDFRFKEDIDYKIYIPFKFINNKLNVENFDSEDDNFLNLLSNIREDIQEEIFRYMKDRNEVI